jgi:hypothetical protein
MDAPMACDSETHVTPWITVVAISTAVVFVPGGEWFDAALLTTGKCFGEVAGRNGAVQAIPVIQMTNDMQGLVGAQTTNMNVTINANGVFNPDADHAITSGAFKYAGCDPYTGCWRSRDTSVSDA